MSIDTWLKLAVLVCGSGLAGSASAACVIWGSPTREFAVSAPITIVGNAAEPGEALTSWRKTDEQEVAACGASSQGEYFQYEGLGTEIGTFKEGDKTYSIYDVSIPGVGMIVGVNTLRDDYNVRDYHPIRAGSSTTQGIPSAAGRQTSLYQDIAVRFIKTGNTTPDDYVASKLQLTELTLRRNSNGGVLDRQTHEVASVSVTVEHRPLCHVQPKTVLMGMAAIPAFEEVNSKGPDVDYSVEMLCEASAGRVGYYLEEVTPSIDRSLGIIGTTGEAVGFGIQLLDAAGDPISIGRAYPFGSSSADGLRSENFKARYIRTEPDASKLEAGRIEARVRYRVDYP